MIEEFNKTLTEFDKYKSQKNKGRLSHVQIIVEFYFFLIEADKMSIKLPFSRYVRVAKKIDAWAKEDIKKALATIWDIKIFFEENNLSWTLDTVYRFIPKYENDEIEHEHEIFSGSDIETWEREKIQKMLKEHRELRKQEKKDKKHDSACL